MKISLRLALCLLLLIELRVAKGQEIDPTFNTMIGSGVYSVTNGAAQFDGKLIISGEFSSVGGSATAQFARLNSDGSLDQTFVTGTGFDGTVNEIAVQDNGKVLVGGSFTQYNGKPSANIVRLNADGTVDNSFNIGTGFNKEVSDVLIQKDGKILVSGSFNKYNNTTVNNIARLNVDGSLDATFSVGSGTGELYIYDIEVQRDGKILVGGAFETFNGKSKSRITRLNTDGSLDATFNPSGSGADYIVTCISIQVINGEDRIVIGGIFNKYNDVTSGRVARIKPDGSYDNEFQVGTGFGSSVVWDVLASFDEIFVAVSDKLAKVSETGTITDLRPGSYSSRYWLGDYGLGEIAVGGLAGNTYIGYQAGVSIITSSGTAVGSFNPALGGTGTIGSVIELSDGKLLIGGDFNSIDGHTVGNIARLNADGTFDNSFTTGTGIYGYTTPTVENLTLQASGKILVTGWFEGFNGTTNGGNLSRLLRLNSNGTLDATFNKTLWLGGPVQDIVSSPDNKVIITNRLNSSSLADQIIRLNTDGSIDNTFNGGIPVAIPNTLYSLVQRPDGRLIFAEAGTGQTTLKYLNTDGTTGNILATIPGTIGNMMIITGPDNELYITTRGYSSGAGVSTYRVDANGTVHNFTSFSASLYYAIASVSGMALSDNTLLIGGYFDRSYDGSGTSTPIRPYFAALDQNGKPQPGATALFDGSTGSIFPLSNNRILVTGSFTKVNNVAKKNYVMLKKPANVPQAPSNLLGEFKSQNIVEISWGDNSDNEAAFEIQRSPAQTNNYATVYQAKANATSWTDTIANSVGVYKYRVRATNFAGVSNYAESQLIMGIEDESASANAVYPNPTRGVVYLNKEALTRATVVTVNDISGQTVFSSQAEESIDLSFLPRGVYILKLQDQSSSTVTRLVKID